MLKELEPIKEVSADYEPLEQIISDYFKQEIYVPLLRELKQSEDRLLNSLDDLTTAIKAGRITFYRGVFKGKFNAATTKELKKLGAVWDRKQGSFRLPLAKLPTSLRDAIATSEEKFLKAFKKMDAKLAKILPEKIAVHDFFDKTIFKLDGKINKTLKGITINPPLTKGERAKIADEYTNNMDLYIKDWTESEIVKLRKRMKKQVLAGGRYEEMVETIQKSYGVSRNKAKFLARQETALLMVTFKKERYLEAGVNQYKWRCVPGTSAHPVRPMHKKLDGKIFSWDHPPVTSENGAHNHPGEDFNCRCVAIPIVRF